MKQYAHKILLVLLAIVLFTMGLGANVFNYCCTDCESNITVIPNLGCCTMHEGSSDESESKFGCCADNENHLNVNGRLKSDLNNDIVSISDGASHCSVSRISINLNLPIDRQIIASPTIWISDFLPILLNLRSQIAEVDLCYKYVDDSPDIHPRTYLSLIQVLVI